MDDDILDDQDARYSQGSTEKDVDQVIGRFRDPAGLIQQPQGDARPVPRIFYNSAEYQGSVLALQASLPRGDWKRGADVAHVARGRRSDLRPNLRIHLDDIQ